MNSTGPPRNGKEKEPRSGDRGSNSQAILVSLNAIAAEPQAHVVSDRVLRNWFREAQRIASEYHRTRRVAHLRAFCRQIIGVMQQVERTLPR